MAARRLTAALAGGVLLLAACGDRAAPPTVAGGERPKLPTGATGATSGMARDSAAGAESLLYPSRSVDYRLADGVEAPARSAAAYQLVPARLDRQRVARLATALGLDGEVQASPEGAFVVRSGPSQLSVGPGSVLSWTYTHDGEGQVGSGVVVACDPGGACPDAPPPTTVPGVPTAAEAEARARTILSRAGLDLDDTRAEVSGDGSAGRTVTIVSKAGGQEVMGLETSLSFGEQGRLEMAYGFLGRFEEVGIYPLVGMEEALERLRSGFGGYRGGPRALGGAEGGSVEGDATQSSPGSEPAGGGGAGQPSDPGRSDPEGPPVTIEPPTPPVPLESEVVEITGVRIALQAIFPNCPGEAVYLVPTFVFEPERAGSVVAVADEALDGVDAGGVKPEPVQPCPGDEPAGKPEPAPATDLPQPAEVPPAPPRSPPPTKP